jgi:hypothetical protein
MTSCQLQQNLFRRILEQIPKEVNLATEVASALNIGTSAAYKSIKGNIFLTFDEITVLAQHYYLGIDELIESLVPSFLTSFSGFVSKDSCLKYLHFTEQALQSLLNASNPKIWYVTNELPFYYYFYFEELALFRIYLWRRMVWNEMKWQNRPFHFNLPERREITTQAKRLLNLYNKIPSVEIWNEHVLDSFLHQLVVQESNY